MMKTTLCSLFVLALVAQICAIPVGKDAEKEVEGAVDDAAAAVKNAKNTATKQAEHANHANHQQHGNHANHPEHGNHSNHPEHGKSNAVDHTGGAKHGGEGGQKRDADWSVPLQKQ